MGIEHTAQTSQEHLELYYKAKQQQAYAETERELYREHCQKLKMENVSLKQSAEFAAREDRKVFDLFCSKIFPNFKHRYTEKLSYCSVIRDWEDSMLGIVTDRCSDDGKFKCYMQDESIRMVDSSSKEWVRFHFQTITWE